MPCFVEESDCDREPIWYCCNCGDGPLNYGVIKKCLDVSCGHEYAKCDRQHPITLELGGSQDISVGKKPSRRRTKTVLPLETSGPNTRKPDTRMMSRSKFMLLSLGQQNANEVADQHLVETAIDPTILYDSPSASATPYSTGSTFSSCFTTPFSENGSLDLCSIIDARAECLTERILGGLYIVHNATSGNFVCTTNGGANSPQSSSRVSLGYPGTSAWKDPQRSDRCPLKRDREEREDEEGGDGDRPKKQNRKTVDSQAQRYACVFLKRNPAKYMHWSSCGSKGWPDTSRLKEHLYRRHLVFRCLRCMGTFRKESDLQKHAREENNCVLDESYLNPSDEGICPETERRLRDRKGQSSLSENEKWKKTYVITFGVSLDDCPSPYFDPNEFEEGRFRRSAADEARQYTDYYRREFRQRIRGPLFDMARRLLTHIAETEVNNRSNSVDSLVIPLEENLVNLLVDVASTVSQLPPSSDTQSERSGVDSISSNITAAPRAPLQPPETMERTALMIGDINLRNNLEDSWASNTRDLTASPFSAFAHPPEVSLQQGPSYLNYVAQASCRSVSEMPSRNNAQYHHGLDDTLSMEYPNTNILESSFYQTTSPHSNSLPENTQSIGENVAKLKSSASSVSAVDGNRRTRALAATKGIESVDDAVFDPGNLITGISSSNDAFTGFELFDTDPNVFEPGDWGNDFIS